MNASGQAADTPVSPVPLRNLVAGRWVNGTGSELLDTNPARPTEIVAMGRHAEDHQLDTAVHAAVDAFPDWAATPFAERGNILARAATVLTTHAKRWGEELSREEGKTLTEGIGEVHRAAEIFGFYAGEAARPVGELYASARIGEQIQVIRRPAGPIAVITPFNFPIAIPAWKIAPALAYGNTVVWKPACAVPLLAMRMTEALVEAGLPEGVLSLVIAEGQVGAKLVEHPGIARVTFTGSTSVGRLLIERCGALARPIQTEMGGKNAAAVLDDADLDLAANEVVAGAFRSTGQKCTATSRVIVTERVAEEFLSLLLQRVNALIVGDPTDSEVEMGPLVSESARDEVRAAIRAATQRPGVRSLTTDNSVVAARDGAFLAPTVVELAGEDPLWREELFGPVLAVRRATTDQEALELVNDSAFGLTAAVFTDNLQAVTAAIQTLDVGVLHINSETAGADPHVPFGGNKDSGFGPKEQGRAAREFLTTTTTVYLKASSSQSH